MNRNTTVAWIKDLARWGHLAYRSVLLPRLGRGYDYTQSVAADRSWTLVSQLHPRQMTLQVVKIITETPTTKTLRLTRIDGDLPPFRPGQYVNLLVEINGVRTSRPYSISSAPGSDHLDLTVRDRPAGFVAPYLLNAVGVGDRLLSSGPAGSFYHEPLVDGDSVVLLAGGSGIAPMMSMLRDQARRGWPLEIQLLYGSRSPDDVIFGDELSTLDRATDRFRYALVISEPPAGYTERTGLLDADLIAHLVPDPQRKTFYLCGPHELCVGGQEALSQLGVARQRIKRELYGPPADITRDPGWPRGLAPGEQFDVEVRYGGNGVPQVRRIRATASEPLISALERHGLVVPSLCRTGECSACRTRILAGAVLTPEHTVLRESDQQFGYAHACMAYPLQDLVVHLPG